MSDAPPAMFDRRLRRLRKARAAPGADDFLQREVAERLADRLADVNRRFALGLVLGTRGDTFGSPKIDRLVRGGSAPARGIDVVVDEETLPFADERFDLIVDCLGLHAVNDVPGTLIQINRALKPDGLFLGAFFGGDTLTELRQSLAAAEIEREGGLSPRVHPAIDVRDGGALLQRAGFALPVADVERIVVRYADPLRLLADLRAMGETNILTERRRTPLKRATLMRALELYRDKFVQGDGRVPATFDVVMLAGWAPHESQQKPLRPGSARMRLADVLGGREHSAGEKAGPR